MTFKANGSKHSEKELCSFNNSCKLKTFFRSILVMMTSYKTKNKLYVPENIVLPII